MNLSWLRILNWQEADQLAIYKRCQGVELGSTVKQNQLVVRKGLETAIPGFQVQSSNSSAALINNPESLLVCEAQ